MNRRNLLKAGAAIPAIAILSACGATSAATVDAQIVADVQGLSTTTASLLAAMNQYAPNAIPMDVQAQIKASEAAALAAAQSLSATTPVASGATTLQTVTGYLNLVLGAVLTTPEVITQIIMFLPLQALYEVSIWVAWYWERNDRKRQAEAEQAGSEK